MDLVKFLAPAEQLCVRIPLIKLCWEAAWISKVILCGGQSKTCLFSARPGLLGLCLFHPPPNLYQSHKIHSSAHTRAQQFYKNINIFKLRSLTLKLIWWQILNKFNKLKMARSEYTNIAYKNKRLWNENFVARNI